VPRLLLACFQRPLNTKHCIYVSLQKLGSDQLTHYDCEIVQSMHFHSYLFGASGLAEITGKGLTLVKPEKNACPASALFQCRLIRSDADNAAAADEKCAARRRRPPVRRRTAHLTAHYKC